VTGPKVTLTNAEVWRSAQVGSWRQCEALKKGHVAFHGQETKIGRWEVHIEGAAAELVVAKALNIYWDSYAEDLGKIKADVGGVIEVRQTFREEGSLICQKKDHEQGKHDVPFVLVVGKIPTFRIVGWAHGWSVMVPEFWRKNIRDPAWLMPQKHLRPISELMRNVNV
jgi:hypothetical protein